MNQHRSMKDCLLADAAREEGHSTYHCTIWRQANGLGGQRTRRDKPPVGERLRPKPVQVRVTEEEHAAFVATAHRIGLSLSGWLRALARRESGLAAEGMARKDEEPDTP